MIIRLRNQYIVNYILKYKIGNLIILYCCKYSELSGIIEDVVQNSMRLMESTESSPQVNKFRMECDLYQKSKQYVDVRWYITNYSLMNLHSFLLSSLDNRYIFLVRIMNVRLGLFSFLFLAFSFFSLFLFILFYFLFHLFLNLGFRIRISHDIIWSHDTEKVLEEMMLYNIATIFWPCKKTHVLQNRLVVVCTQIIVCDI